MGAVLWSAMLHAVLCATQPLQPLKFGWRLLHVHDTAPAKVLDHLIRGFQALIRV